MINTSHVGVLLSLSLALVTCAAGQVYNRGPSTVQGPSDTLEAWFETLHKEPTTVVGDPSVDEETPLLGGIRDVYVDDVHEWVYVLERQDQAMSVVAYHLASGQTCTFGSFGRGPGEFTDVVSIDMHGDEPVVLEGIGRLSTFRVSDVDTCKEIELVETRRMEAPRLSSACFADGRLVGFDDRFTEREGFLHLFDGEGFAHEQSIGSLPEIYTEELHPLGGGSVYCLGNDRLAATYEAGTNVVSIFSMDGETLRTISFEGYPAPQVITRTIEGQTWYSWDMEDAYRVHAVTPVNDDELLVQIRPYDEGGATPDPELESYLANLKSGERTYLGMSDREFVYITEDLWVAIQQPRPVPRVMIHQD